jgi:hypothetical protein
VHISYAFAKIELRSKKKAPGKPGASLFNNRESQQLLCLDEFSYRSFVLDKFGDVNIAKSLAENGLSPGYGGWGTRQNTSRTP